MIQHKIKCTNSNCKCWTMNLYPKASSLQVEASSKSPHSIRRRSEKCESEIFIMRQIMEQEEEDVATDNLMIYSFLKDILTEQLTDESSCYLYIYKAYIEKYYLSQKFQALNSISYANEKDPSLYEQFLIFCFRYKYIYILFIYIKIYT